MTTFLRKSTYNDTRAMALILKCDNNVAVEHGNVVDDNDDGDDDDDNDGDDDDG